MNLIYDGPSDAKTTIVCAHGAGAGSEHPFMQTLAQSLGRQGMRAVRFDFPFVELGRKSPGNIRYSEERYREVVESLGQASGSVEPPKTIIAAGKSYGGRVGSHLVAQKEIQVSGLVFFGYPLHRPGAPETIRDKHLYDIEVPMLFLQGSRDPFATSELLEQVVAKCQNASIKFIEEGGHSFKLRGREHEDVIDELAQHTKEFALSLRS